MSRIFLNVFIAINLDSNVNMFSDEVILFKGFPQMYNVVYI